MTPTELIANYMQMGYRVESQGPNAVVMVRGNPVNHLLHLVLTLLTGGLWVIVWIGVAMANQQSRVIVHTDEEGQAYITTV